MLLTLEIHVLSKYLCSQKNSGRSLMKNKSLLNCFWVDRVNDLNKNNDKSRYNKCTTTKKPGSSKYYLERKNKKGQYILSLR